MTNTRERKLWTAIGCLSALQALTLLLLFTGSQRPLAVVQHPETSLAGPRRALLEVGPRRRLPRGRRRGSAARLPPPAPACPRLTHGMNSCTAASHAECTLGRAV